MTKTTNNIISFLERYVISKPARIWDKKSKIKVLRCADVSVAENSYQKAAGIWKELSFQFGARNTLLLPLELEQDQFLIGFKIWNGTFLQSSVNQAYPVEAEWVLANHLPCELFCLGPL